MEQATNQLKKAEEDLFEIIKNLIFKVKIMMKI
jgi:hypothetical protein